VSTYIIYIYTGNKKWMKLKLTTMTYILIVWAFLRSSSKRVSDLSCLSCPCVACRKDWNLHRSLFQDSWLVGWQCPSIPETLGKSLLIFLGLRQIKPLNYTFRNNRGTEVMKFRCLRNNLWAIFYEKKVSRIFCSV